MKSQELPITWHLKFLKAITMRRQTSGLLEFSSMCLFLVTSLSKVQHRRKSSTKFAAPSTTLIMRNSNRFQSNAKTWLKNCWWSTPKSAWLVLKQSSIHGSNPSNKARWINQFQTMWLNACNPSKEFHNLKGPPWTYSWKPWLKLKSKISVQILRDLTWMVREWSTRRNLVSSSLKSILI